MKKILFFALWLLIISTTACNNNDKGKETKSDTVRVKAFTDPGAINAKATIDNISFYKRLDNTTKKVSYNYIDFMEAIKSWDSATGSTAKEIYLVYGAYTIKDSTWYMTSHRAISKKMYLDSVLNQPCLMMGYADPNNAGKFFYKEFGTICPPPTSCETVALIPNRKEFFATTNYTGFDAAAAIDNFNSLYNTDASQPLTEMVKFNIDSIRNLVTAAGTAINSTIYFFMGAYDNNDANRYRDTHPGFNISPTEIQNKTCLLFGLFNTKNQMYSFYDFGTLCPPQNSCASTFK